METETDHRRAATKESNVLATGLTLAVFVGVVGAATAAAYKIGEHRAAAETRSRLAVAAELEQRQRAPLLAEIAALKTERDTLRRALLVQAQAGHEARVAAASRCTVQYE